MSAPRFLIQDIPPLPFQLVDSGLDGCSLVIRVCLNQVLLSAGEVKNLQLQQKLLSYVFRYCLHKTCFATSFCEALTTIALADDFLESLSNLLELSVAEKVGVGLALSDSEDSEIKQKGRHFCESSDLISSTLIFRRSLTLPLLFQGNGFQLLKLKSCARILSNLYQMIKFMKSLCFCISLLACRSIWTL